MPRRIALLTDFGTRDPYVAAMKGVLAARTDAAVVDLSHEIAPFDVFEAAWFLRAIEPYWPPDSIVVTVVDPGVGSSRRIIALSSNGRIFLAPDNGVLTFVAGAAFAVTNESLFLDSGATTFHGRDRFAPVAAALANGLAVEQLGPAIDDRVKLAYEPPRYDCARAEGTIVAIDRFGNAITDIVRDSLTFERFELRVGAHCIARIERNYADAADGAFLIVGSTGHLEVSMRNANAADELELRRGAAVVVVPR